ncbi:hypothetical protein N9955_00425 [bacterium]|nr:hypothetical protein [bacterium]
MKEENKQKIEGVREKIQESFKHQDDLYKELVKELQESEDSISNRSIEFLWDYVFNCDENTTESFLKYIKGEIFK